MDAETGKALAGVTYRLFDANGKKVADMTTGADGKAVFKDLPQGKYSYQEISAPSGYVVDNTKYQITITATALNITQKRTNTPAKASIEIVKVDADNKAPLQGAGFRLYDTSGKQVAEGYTDANGKLTFSNLRLGSYTYKEFKAPDGYVLDTTAYSAVLNKNGQVLKVTRENTPIKGSIEVLKVDAETKQPLAGVVYRLFDADGNKIADGTTDVTGKVTFSGLRLGKYVYQEINTVDGYVLDETKYDFSLTTANLNIKVTRENAPAKGSITVRKVDVTGSPLAGAELMLETSADGKTWSEVGKITTDKAGIAKWSDLKIGVQYRVTETKAPAAATVMSPSPPATMRDLPCRLQAATVLLHPVCLQHSCFAWVFIFAKDLTSKRRQPNEKDPSRMGHALGRYHGSGPHHHSICRADHRHQQESIPFHLQIRHHQGRQ